MHEGKIILQHTGEVIGVAYSPDGNYVASIAMDKYLVIYSMSDGKIRSIRMSPQISPTCMCWSASPNFLAVGMEDLIIYIWDIMSGKIIKKLLGHSSRINCLSWRKYLASGDDARNIMIWDPQKEECITSLHSTGSILDIDWSWDGEYLVSGGSDKRIMVWRMLQEKPIVTLTGHMDAVVSVVFSRDGKLIASCGADGILRIWRFGIWKPVKSIRLNSAPNSMDWSPDQKTIAIAQEDGKLVLINADTWKLRSIYAHREGLTTVAWSPDSRTIVSGGKDGIVKLWRI